MVALVSGSSLGLLNTSVATLGSQGAFGNALTGRSAQGAYVNAATGNLVLQGTDEYLASHGLDVPIVRTYNSQGLLDDDNGDGWQLGTYKKVDGLTGRVNRAGSTITRTEGDGSASVYTYDSASGVYRSTAGSGAYDTLDHHGNTWTWTDGQSGVTETYDDDSGLITRSTDVDGNDTTYRYNGRGLMTAVADESGDRLLLDYTGNNLTQVRVNYNDGTGSHTQTRTRYVYDTQNRLVQVTTDLSPQNNSVSDGNTYWTRFTYEGSSRRVSSLAQKDGTALAFSYVQAAGVYRVASVTDGEGRLTRYAYDTVARSTAVTDPLGQVTTFWYDAAGQLTQVRGPVVDGAAQLTRYGYSAQGDLLTVTDARGLTVTMAYDGNGNQVEQRDAARNTVRRRFSDTNRVLVETVYAVPDPDAGGPAQPAGAQSTRFAYDNEDHLRFSVSAEGRVTEYQYNGRGERTASILYSGSLYDVSALATTATLDERTLSRWTDRIDLTAAQRTDYSYDALGQLRSATRWATLRSDGTGRADGQQSVTTYAYGPSGELLQLIDANGNQASFAYDGLNRVIASTDANRVVTTTSYDDSGNRTIVKLANGLWTTSAYDRSGELVSVTQSNAGGPELGTTRYSYDAAGRLTMETDPNGLHTWHLYDAAGRKTADIDAAGSLVEHRYDADNQPTRTIRYAGSVAVGALVDAAGNPTGVDVSAIRPATSPNDRSEWTVYDVAGRVIQRIDGEGFVTATEYDGVSRVVRVTHFATAVDLSSLTDAPLAVAVPSSADDRVSRNFYDSDANLLGQLDAEGFLTTYAYDAAGRRIGSYAFSQRSPSALRAAGTSAQLAPAKVPGRDIATTVFYDRKGRLVGTVDGENYLTEQVFDLAGNLVRKLRYATAVVAGDSLSATRPRPSVQDQSWTYAYTALNQLATETAPDGTVTRSTYDDLGRLVQTTVGWQSEDPRTATRRYDLQGRLIAQLGGEGSAQLALAASPGAIESVWASYGSHYAYDAGGRRISSTDPVGQRTLYFYDAHGNLAAQVDAAGEAQASSYDALGNVQQTVVFARRLDAGTLGLLAGGDIATAASALTALADPARDAVTTFAYDRDGRLVRSTDALGFATGFSYDAFDLRQTRGQVDASRELILGYRYDHRGAQVESITDPSGMALTETSTYDAFGRLVESVDGNGNRTTRDHDRLGRLVTLQAPIGLSTTQYDAFDRVTLVTDASGRQTRTAYDTSARRMTVTLPDGVTLVTVSNRHGEQVSFADGRGNTTTYGYDKDGRLKDLADAGGSLEHDEWDHAGHRLSTRDANGVTTAYSYDAVGRVLTQTLDPAGLNLTTLYGYDTSGRVLSVTDSKGVVTRTTYNARGEVQSVTQDVGGLNLATATQYDGRGRVLTVTDPAGRETRYGYDTAGRRISETLAGLTTTYAYDRAGNVVARRDPAGNTTRFVYDANDREVYRIDPAGGVFATSYDAAGRTAFQQQFVNAVSLQWLASLAPDRVLQPAEVAAQLHPAQRPLAQASGASGDLAVERILDAQGRVAFTIDSAGGLTQSTYDAAGNVIRRTAFANPLANGVAHTYQAIAASLPAATSRDQVTISNYDTRNRVTRQLDGTGALTTFRYDANGNVTERVTFATPVSDIAQTPAPAQADQRQLMAYDAAGRLTARATAQKYDASGANLLYAAERFEYDAAGNLVVHRTSADFLSSASFRADTAAWVATLPVDDSHDRVEKYEYDAAGRLSRKTAPEGGVCDYSYDAGGNLVAQVEYASAGANRADTANRITRTVYDAAGRAVYVIYAEGSVTRQIYDAASRVTKTIRYAHQIALAAFDGLGNPAGLQLTQAAVEGVLQPDSARDRVEQNLYDAAGRLAYSIDAEGAFKRTDYDAAGHVRAVTRFGVPIDAWGADRLPDTWTSAAADAALSVLLQGRSDEQRVDIFNYDGRGRLLSSTDPLGFSEVFTYDAVGNKRSFTNKSGAIWTYDYDAAGRLIEETSPEVQVTVLRYASDGGGALPSGASRIVFESQHLIVTPVTVNARVVTSMRYDAQGNLLSRTEAAGSETQRTTRYEYDAAGRQIKTLFPQVDVDDGTVPANTDLGRHETMVQLFSTVSYDALGNALSARDVAGNESSKAYDRAGRLTGETDAMGGVTQYQRNAFGDVERLTRKGRLAGEVDRTITTTYDRLGRAVQVRQPLAFSHDTRAPGDGLYAQTTWTEYDAFGDAVKVRTGGTDSNGAGAFTTGIERYYYDRRGDRIGSLSELDGADGTAPGGYLTQTRYDAERNSVEVTEFASLISGPDASFENFADVRSRAQGSPDDRTVLADFDALGRKLGETRIGRYTGGTARDQLRTDFYYDAVGNLTGTRDAAGALTLTRYDSLGRVKAVIAPTQTDIVGGTSVTPLTEFKLDAYGNVVARTDYAGGATGIASNPLASGGGGADHYATVSYDATSLDAVRDRRTYFAYDTLGRSTAESDALGTVTERSYDAAGHVVHTWTPVITPGLTAVEAAYSINRYDAAGRLVDTLTPGSTSVDMSGNVFSTGIVTAHLEYDSFGEVVRKTVNGLEVERDDYDNAGRLWRTRGTDGVARITVHDVDGRSAQTITNAVHDLMAATSADAGRWEGSRVSETLFDSMGRAVATVSPTQTLAPEKSQQQIAFVQVDFDKNAQAKPVSQSSGTTNASDGTVTLSWSGSNQVALRWPSLADLGGGDVRVRIEYQSPEEKIGDVITVPPAAGAYEQTFESWQAVDGATLTWTSNDGKHPGLGSVTRVVVSKKGLDGSWQTLVDRPGTGAWGIWITADAPPDIGQTAQLWFRSHGSSGPYQLGGPMRRFGDRLLYSYEAGITGGGSFDYEVRWGDSVEDSGLFTITAKVGVIAPDARPLLGTAGLSWASPPAGTYQRLMLRLKPDGAWHDVVDERKGLNADWIQVGGGMSTVGLHNLPIGSYEYELLFYSGNDDAGLFAHANGDVNIGPDVKFGSGVDASGAVHTNVLTWPAAPTPGDQELVEARTVDLSVEPPVYGDWVPFNDRVETFGDRHGVAIDGGGGPLQYQVSYVNAGGYSYAHSVGVVYILPAPTTPVEGFVDTLAWPAPKPLVLGGVSYPVQQVVTLRRDGELVPIGASAAVEMLTSGLSGLSFDRYGAIDGLAHVWDYTLTWSVPTYPGGGATLGSVGGHLRFGPSQPVVVPAQGTQGAQLLFDVPADRAGERMEAHLFGRAKGAADWVPQAFSVTTAGGIYDLGELPAGEYEYRIDYRGKEAPGQPEVTWCSNVGSFVTLPQPRFGAQAELNPTRVADLERVLSWASTGDEAPTNVSITLRSPDGVLSNVAPSYGAGSRNWINFNGREPGDYEYSLAFTRPDGSALGTVSGTVSIVPEPVMRPGADAMLVWKAPENVWPGRGVQQMLQVSPRGQNNWSLYPAQYNANAGEYQIDLSSLPPSAWDFRLTFSGGVSGTASGSLVSFPPPSVGPADGTDTPYLAWTTPPIGVHTVLRFAQSSDANPDYASLITYNGQFTELGLRQGVPLSLIPPGHYVYQVEYLEDGTDVSFGTIRGQANTVPVATLETLSEGGISTPVLTWPAPTAAQPYTVQLNVAGQSLPEPTSYTVDGVLRQRVRLGALGTGTFDYTLSFSNEAGTLSSSGSVRHVAPATFDGSTLSWARPPGLTAIVHWRLYDPTGQAPFDNTITAFNTLPNDRQGLDLSALPAPQDYEYRLEFVDASGASFGSSDGELRLLPALSYGTLGSTLLSWEAPPAGISQQLSYKLHGDPDGSFKLFPTSQLGFDGSHYFITTRNLGAGDYDIKVEFMRAGFHWGITSAQIHAVTQPSFGVDGASVLSWSEPSPGLTATLQLSRNGLPIAAVPVAVGNASNPRSGIDVSGFAAGDYSYRLVFSRNGSVFGETDGSFQVAAKPSVGMDAPNVVEGTLGRYFTWSTPPAGAQETMEYQNLDLPSFAGTVSGMQVPHLANGLSGWDISLWPAGRYHYKLTITGTDGTTSVTESQITVVPDPSVTTTGVFTWPVGPGGESAVLYYQGAGHPVEATDGTYRFDLSTLAPADYPFTIVYSDAQGEYAQVTSTLSVHQVGAPVGTSTNMDQLALAMPLTISKATGADGNPTTRISFAYAGTDPLTFYYSDAWGAHPLTVSVAGGIGTVDVGQLPSGSYGYELRAVSPAGYYSHSTGSFSLNHAGETFTLPVRQITGFYVSPAGQLRWPRPDHAVAGVVFAWKAAGAAEWQTNITPRQEGGELVVDVSGMPVGDYDVGLVYTGINPVTGDVIWTDNALGTVSITTQVTWHDNWQQVFQGYALYPAVNYPHIYGATVANVNFTGAEGTGHFILATVPDPRGSQWDYNGTVYTWSAARIDIPVPIGALGYRFYDSDVNGVGISNVYYAHLMSVGNITVPYTISYLDPNGTVIAQNTGYYTESGGNGYFTDTSPPYIPASYQPVYSYQNVPYQTIETIRTISYVPAPSTYVDSVTGAPVYPTLGDQTLPPVPQHNEFTLFGSQDLYDFRGAGADYRIVTATSIGAGIDAANASHIAQVDYGTTAVSAGAHTTAVGVGSINTIALSQQRVAENLTVTSSGARLGAHEQIMDNSQATWAIKQFGATNNYVADATVAGTLPVSLPLDKNWIDTAIDSHPQDVTEAARVNTRYDRWGDALSVSDARNGSWQTTYTYSAAGQMLTETKPAVDGMASITRVTYDLQGHATSVTDANVHTTAYVYDNAGHLLRQTNADGGQTLNRYNAFGSRTQTLNPSGSNPAAAQYVVTDFSYDLKGQLVSIAGPAAQNWLAAGFNSTTQQLISEVEIGVERGVQRFVYDSLGRRVTTTFSTDDGKPIDRGGATERVATTRYDMAGNVVGQSDFDGSLTAYSFDALGRKTREQNNQRAIMTWSYNGGSSQVDVHTGLDGVAVKSLYDHAGELVQENTLGNRVVDADDGTAGMNRLYSYDARGELTRIVDTSRAGVTQTTSYRYDAAGNRVVERTESKSGDVTLTLQDSHSSFDAQGRLKSVQDGRVAVDYSYDAAGNKLEEHSAWINDPEKVGESGTAKHSDMVMTYDAMNRVLTQRDTASQDAAQWIGKTFTYDLQGRQTSQKWYGKQLTAYYDTQLQRDHWLAQHSGETTENYTYDDAGRLTHILRDGRIVENRFYDAQGRLVDRDGTVLQNLREDLAPQELNALGLDVTKQHNVYEGASQRISHQYVESLHQTVAGAEPQYAFGVSGHTEFLYDAMGNLKNVTTQEFGAGYVSTNSTAYNMRAIGDSYQVLSETTQGARVRRLYDGNGFITGVRQDYQGASPERKIYTDAQGHVLRNQQLDHDGNPTIKENFLIAQGQQLAKTANDKLEKDYVGTDGITTQFTNLASAKANNGSASSYVVQKEDTLQSIAKAVYGDASYWYAIADANGISGSGELSAGKVLILPGAQSIGAGSTNNASTVKPYDPSQAIGENGPNLPMPALGDGCGGIGQVIVAVVAIAITFYTVGVLAAAGSLGQEAFAVATLDGATTGGGAAATFSSAASVLGGSAGAGAAFAGGVAGAVAGSVSSQLMGISLGLQDRFSWRNVALSAISGGVGAGLGALATPDSFLSSIGGIGRAALGSAATQGVAVAVGLQPSFSWRQVAASAAGAAVSQALDFGLGAREPQDGVGSLGPLGRTGANDLLRAGMSSLGAGLATAALRGGRVSVQQVATDAFAQVLGHELVSQLAMGGQQEQLLGNALGQKLVDQSNSDAPTVTAGDFARHDRAAYIDYVNTQQWIAQSDAIQGNRLGENYVRQQDELTELGGRLIQAMPVSGYGDYVKEMTPGARHSAPPSSARDQQVEQERQVGGPPVDPTDGLRAGPTRERAAEMRRNYLQAARDVVGSYNAEMAWRERSSGRLEAPPISPEDIAFLAAGVAARGGRIAADGLGKVIGEDASALLARIGVVGDSTILRRAMLEAGMVIPDGYVAHHLIPSSMAKGEFGELFELAGKNGYKINAAGNGMALPKTVADALASGDPLHRGGHLGEYFEAAQTELRSLRAAVKAGDLAPSALPQALNEVSLVMQAKLISREIFLTRQDPMYLLFRK